MIHPGTAVKTSGHRLPALRIVVLCIAAAVLYGLVMDQITIRVCPEYFTIAHPRVIHTRSLTVLALYWGVAATWWVGLLLGAPLAYVSRRKAPQPPICARDLIRPLGLLLAVMAVCTILAGVTGYLLAKRGAISPADWQWDIPPEAHAAFVADAFAHLASYAAGLIGGAVLIIRVVKRRSARAARAAGSRG